MKHSTLCLNKRLTVQSKRLGHERWCGIYNTGSLPEVLLSHYLDYALLKNASSLSKDRGFWWDPKA
eukprot:UN00831